MTFYVKRMPSGRVYLCPNEPVKGEELLETIQAETWLQAREKTQPKGFDRYTPRKGYGYIE